MKKLMLVTGLLATATLIGGVTQEGAVLSQAGADDVYTWTANGSVTIPEGGQLVDLLVVGGGGGGGGQGGGGGGGVAYYQKLQLPAGTYAVTIGAGGKGAGADAFSAGSTGSASRFGDLYTVLGGSGGGGWSNAPKANGANGAGGSTMEASNVSDPTQIPSGKSGMKGTAGVAAEGQVGTGHTGGNATNNGSGTTGNGGGGGGAGAGADGQHSQVFTVASNNDATAGEHAGNGGDGYLCAITGVDAYYGGGGGGGVRRSNYKLGGIGGQGGGGNGGGGTPETGAVYAGTAGTDGLGGGGGAAGWDKGGTARSAGNGGSGVVILRVHNGNEVKAAADETSFTVKCTVRDLQGADAVDILVAYAADGDELPTPEMKKSGAVKDEVVDVEVDGLTTGVTYAYKVVYCKTGTSEEIYAAEGTVTPHPEVTLVDSAVWVSGLKQAKFNSSYDKTSGLADSKISVEATPGPVMADVKTDESGYSTKGYTNPYTGVSYYYNKQNTTFAYFGYIWLEAGVQYNFAKNIDDSGYIKIGETVVLDDSNYQSYPVKNFTAEESGWFAVDMRCGDGSGGKGPSGGGIGSAMGLGYNKGGVTKQQSTGWDYVRDPNDGSFLRTEDPKIASMMSVSTLKKSGADVVFFASFKDVPAASELRAYYDVADRGDTPALWDNYVKVADVPSGTTDVARYVATGAANGFVRIALVVKGTDTVQGRYQFTGATAFSGENPIVSVSVESVGFTGAMVAVTVSAMGGDATEATAKVLVSTSEDMTGAREIALASEFTGPGTRQVEITELLTNTTYYVCVSAENDAGFSATSSVKNFLTLTPTASSGFFLLKSNISTSQTFLATVTDLGDDSSTATITMQCATDEDFTEGLRESDPLDIGEDDLNVEKELTVTGLQKNTPYYSRLKIVNAWGLTYYAETFFCPTLDSLVVQGVGYTAVEGGFNVDVVVSYMDGDSATVELFANGVSVGSKTLTAAGTASFGVSSAADMTTLRTVVTGDVAVEKTVSAKKGTTQVVVDTLVGHDTAATAIVLNVGDKVSLPELVGKMKFENLSGHRFLKLENGEVTALEPGFGAIEQYDIDGSYLATASVLIKPDMQVGGRVFVYDFKVNKGWADAGSWVQVGADARDAVPDDSKDVVFVLMTSAKDQNFKVAGEQNVQDIYFCSPFDAATNFRFSGNAATGCRLNICGIPSGRNARPGTFMVAAVGTTVANKMENFYFGGSGSGSAVTLGCAGDVNFDLGGRSYNPGFENSNNGIIRMENVYGFIDIPEGRKLSCVNGHAKSGTLSDGQPGNERCWGFSRENAITGKGVFEIAASGEFYLTGKAFSAFEGEIVDSMQNVVTKFSSDRSGPCWSSLHDMPNATLTIAGYVPVDFSITKSVGVFTQGNNGWGSSAFVGNGIPYRGVNLDGGYLRFHKYQAYNGTPIYAPDGETIVDYEVYNQTSNLNVRSGMTYMYIRDEPGSDEVIRRFTAESVTHAGSGSLIVQDARTWKGNTTARSFMELGDISAFYVGNTADVDLANDVFPVVPWLMTHWGGNDSPWWGYVGADGIMCRGGVRTNTNLSEVADPRRNALVHSKTLSVAADTIVNSLVLSDLKGQSLAGHRLTISSGGLILRGSSGLGTADGGESNGSVVFPERAYVWSLTTSASSPSAIWSPITAPNGVVAAGAGYLRLGGDQTGIDGDITVNGGQFELGDTSGNGCQIDVPINLVGGNTKLQVNQAGTLKLLTLNLSCPGGYGPKITVPAAGEKCTALNVDGVSMPRGVYGAIGSGAEFESEHIADGSGFLTVRTDDYQSGFMIYLR